MVKLLFSGGGQPNPKVKGGREGELYLAYKNTIKNLEKKIKKNYFIFYSHITKILYFI